MKTPILLLALAACYPRLDVSGGGAGVGGDDAGADGGAGEDGSGEDGGGAGGGEDGGGDDGTTAPAPALSAVSPEHGSNAGGLQVTLSGSDLGEGTRVFFGAEEATVLTTGDASLVVEVPAASGAVGPVSVRVETDGGEDSLSAAFTYWDDESGNAVTLLRARAIEGWDSTGEWTSFQALGWHTTPAQAWSTDTQAALGGCTSTYSTSSAVDAPDSMWLSGGLGEIELERYSDTDVFLVEDDAPGAVALLGTRHDVHLGPGGAWPAYAAEEGLEFPDDLELYVPDPWEYDSYDIDNFVLEWRALAADRIMLGFFDASSDALVICTVDDTGEYTVPATTYSTFTPSEDAWWGRAWVMQVVVLAYKDTATTLDFNNGELRAQGGVGHATWVRVEDSWF
jgi:hypothetical protein